MKYKLLFLLKSRKIWVCNSKGYTLCKKKTERSTQKHILNFKYTINHLHININKASQIEQKNQIIPRFFQSKNEGENVGQSINFQGKESLIRDPSPRDSVLQMHMHTPAHMHSHMLIHVQAFCGAFSRVLLVQYWTTQVSEFHLFLITEAKSSLASTGWQMH